jgi:WD40 repeat protein
VNAVRFAPDGKHLAVLSQYGTRITVFESADWGVETTFRRESNSYAFNSLAFMNHDTLLFSAASKALPADRNRETDNNFALETRSISRPGEIAYLPTQTDISFLHTANTFAASPDRRLVVAIIGNRVFVANAELGRLVTTLSTNLESGRVDFADSIAFSPDGRTLAIGTFGGRVLLVDTATWDITRRYDMEAGTNYIITALTFSPDSQFIVTGLGKAIDLRNPSVFGARIWRVSDGSLVSELRGGTYVLAGKENAAQVNTMAWQGGLLAIGDEMSLHVWRITAGDPQLLVEREMRLGVYSVAFSPVGALAAADNSEVVIYEVH